MIGAIYSGLSGLKTHQTKIDVIGNNLANINTIGFKKGRAVFSEAFTKTLKNGIAATGDRGSQNPMQVGAGSKIGAIDVMQATGSPQITGVSTDLMIRGKGMFVLQAPDGASNVVETSTRAIRASSVRTFTRAGNFGLDTGGELVYKTNGYRVLGWTADPLTGEVDTSNADALGFIRFPFTRSISQATSTVEYAANLDARSGQSQVIHDSGTGIVTPIDMPTTGTALKAGAHMVRVALAEDENGVPIEGKLMASLDGGTQVEIVEGEDGRKQSVFLDAEGGELLTVNFEDVQAGIAAIDFIPQSYKNTIGVFDTLGQRHDVEVIFTKNLNPNAEPGSWNWRAGKVSDGTLVSGAGNISFNTGNAAFARSNPNIPEITIKPSGDGDEFTFRLNFSDLTQFASGSDAVALRQDGVGPGTLSSFSIGADGLIDGIFSNGINRAIAQLAIADLPNPEGMTRIHDTMFALSPSSGTPSYVAGGGKNMGEITSGTLEMSNVNLTEEFTDLITAERGFQASSRIITTSDEIIQESLGMKR